MTATASFDDGNMYYVISQESEDGDYNADVVFVSKTPAKTNMSGEVKTKGWCGTFGGVATYAHGAYETIEEAKKVVARKVSGCRPVEDDGEEFSGEAFLIHEYDLLERDVDSQTFLFGSLDGDETDEELGAYAEELEGMANQDGSTWGDGLLDDLCKFRDEIALDSKT